MPAPGWSLDDERLRVELLSGRVQLDEAVGLELWRSVAKVEIWATAAERGETLWSGAVSAAVRDRRAHALREASTELVGPLQVFGALSDRPAGVTAAELIQACQTVANWAEGHGLTETAVHFSEAAAAVEPFSPALANLAARICRRAGYRARAELWYERAIGLARTSQNVSEYIAAHLGVGSMLRDAGEHTKALPLIKRAGLTAKRAGLRAQAAEALHDVFTIALLREDYPRAAVYARRALTVYPRHHQRYPYMAADFAGLLIRKGLFPAALSILEGVLRKLTAPADQFQLLGSIAWAAGGAGREDRFVRAQEAAVKSSSTFPESRPGVLYYIGEGARQLGDWTTAYELAVAAAEAAEATGDVVTAGFASRLADAASKRVPGISPLPADDASGEVLRRLAPTVRLLLRKWRGPSWRPPRQD